MTGFEKEIVIKEASKFHHSVNCRNILHLIGLIISSSSNLISTQKSIYLTQKRFLPFNWTDI